MRRGSLWYSAPLWSVCPAVYRRTPVTPGYCRHPAQALNHSFPESCPSHHRTEISAVRLIGKSGYIRITTADGADQNLEVRNHADVRKLI